MLDVNLRIPSMSVPFCHRSNFCWTPEVLENWMWVDMETKKLLLGRLFFFWAFFCRKGHLQPSPADVARPRVSFVFVGKKASETRINEKVWHMIKAILNKLARISSVFFVLKQWAETADDFLRHHGTKSSSVSCLPGMDVVGSGVGSTQVLKGWGGGVRLLGNLLDIVFSWRLEACNPHMPKKHMPPSNFVHKTNTEQQDFYPSMHHPFVASIWVWMHLRSFDVI